MWKIICDVISGILFVLGLAGIPDSIKIWSGWIGDILTVMDQNLARWIFLGVGLFLFSYVHDSHKRIWSRFRFNKPKIKADLKIKCDNTGNAFLHIGAADGVAMNEGRKQTIRLKVANEGEQEIYNVDLQLLDIQPLPNELRGKLPLPLHFTDYHDDIGRLNSLKKTEERLVDLFSFFTSRWNCNMVVEEAVAEANRVKIITDVYYVTVKTTGNSLSGTNYVDIKKFQLKVDEHADMIGGREDPGIFMKEMKSQTIEIAASRPD